MLVCFVGFFKQVDLCIVSVEITWTVNVNKNPYCDVGYMNVTVFYHLTLRTSNVQDNMAVEFSAIPLR